MVTTDQTMVVAAFGIITELDDSGYSTGWYNTLSIISTTTFDALPTATTPLGISVAAIAMVIPSSLAAPTPSGTSTSTPNPLYFLFHEPFTISIVILVSIGVGACVLFWCCCSCCRRRRVRRPNSAQIWTTPIPSPYHPSSYNDSGPVEPRRVPFSPSPAPPLARPTPPPTPPSPADECPHKQLVSCSVSWLSSCCSCADKRREVIKREKRTRKYCTACQRYWRAKSLSELPSAWGLQKAHEEQEQRKKRAEEAKLAQEKAANLKIPLYPRSNSEPVHFRSLSATDQTHGQMHDLGPTYKTPVFHDADHNRPGRGSNGSGGQQRKTSARGFLRAYDSEAVINSGSVNINRTGSGPPSATFGGDPAAAEDEIYPKPSSSAGASSTGTARSRTSALSAAERRRERESRGLQRNEPQFSVNPDGTLNNG